MKKLLLMLTLALLCVASASAWDFNIKYQGDHMYFIYYDVNEDGNTVTVTRDDYDYFSYSDTVDIPSTVTYEDKTYTVTAIGKLAFSSSGIVHITIPETVTSIGDLAFYCCRDLQEIILPKNLLSIGERAFYQCTGLTEVAIPNYVTSIKEETFSHCENLESIIFGDSLSTIGTYAFYECSSLKEVTIPQSMTLIEDSAFLSCFSLWRVYNLSKLNIVKGSETNGYVAYYAGEVISQLPTVNSVILDKDVVEMKVGETIPLIVTVLPEDAIDKTIVWTSTNENVATVDQNGVVTAISGGNATIVASCAGISASCEISVRGYDFAVANDDGIIIYYDINDDHTVSVTNDSGSMDSFSGSVSIPSDVSFGGSSYSVSSIGDGAFSGCREITSINIPNSVESIGNGAFENCGNLTKATVGKSVTSIGNKAFYGCENLKSVYNLSELDIVKGETTNGYIAYYADLVLNGLPLTSIVLDITNVKIVAGETVTITATVLPIEAYDKTVVWTSNNENIATVDQNGVVKAISEGIATITASCGGLDATCEVFVFDTETGISGVLSPEEIEIYDLNGIRVNNPVRGMYIVKTAVGVKKVIIR